MNSATAGTSRLSLALPLQMFAGLVIGLVLWSSRRASELWTTFALAGAGSLLIGPHAYGYDGTMLLLPALCHRNFLTDQNGSSP